MDDDIVEMANQFSLESSRNSTSEVTVGNRDYLLSIVYLIYRSSSRLRI